MTWSDLLLIHDVASTVQLSLLVALAGAIAYVVYVLYVPMNRVRDLSQVGFWHLRDDDKRKVPLNYLVNRVLQQRKIGDLPPVYPNGWFLLVESRDLIPGGVKSFNALGQNFAIFRAESGEAYVIDAYCPHLGANLAVGGKVQGDCIECPFHGWRFKGSNGMCASIPYSDKVPDFAKVKSWPTREINGGIYVWHHAEGLEPSWEIPEVAGITSGKWVYRGRTEFYISAHIQEIPENGADIAHLPQVHTNNVLCGSDLRKLGNVLLDFTSHFWNASWEAMAEPNSHVTSMVVAHSLRIFGCFNILTMSASINQIGPAIVYMTFPTPFGQGTLIQNVTPVGPLLQKVCHYFFCEPSVPHFYSFLLLYSEAIMVERDIMVWNQKQFLSKPLLVKEDKFIMKYRRWYSQFYSEHSPRFKFQKENLEW